MDEKKYQIFVSSTYNDLISARAKIIETILRLFHFPIGMEMFSADDAEQWEVIKDTIDQSDYYIVLIGHRYGSLSSEGISFTEKEYDYAKEKGIPILAFVRNREVATKPDERDADFESSEKLEKFISKATKSKMCEYWEKEDDLSTKVAIALPKIFRKTQRTGWVRADRAISPEVSEELARLSSESRDLRNLNEELKAKIEKRKPAFKFLVNNTNKLLFKLASSDNMAISFGEKKLKIDFLKEPQELLLMDVPQHLKPFMKSSEIENYNKNLPNREVVHKFNEKLEYFWRIKETYLDFNFQLENFGIAKASNIFIDIKVPEGLKILQRNDLEDIEYPNKPMPENPIAKAEKEFKERQKIGAYGFVAHFEDSLVPFREFESLKDIMLSREREYNIQTEDNQVTIKLKNLLHTRNIFFEELILVPFRSGHFTIDFTLICEELDSSINFQLPVIISA